MSIIVNCGEIELLLPKARQILKHYDEALGVKTVVLGGSGHIINAATSRICEICKKGKTYPCKKVHLAALAKSRRTRKSLVYSCIFGFSYWTSPLYRNRRYVGALAAGQPLGCGREEAEANFRRHFNGGISEEMLKEIFDDVKEKNSDEIRAMSGILELCAQEISEAGEELNRVIRRVIRCGGESKSIKFSVPENQVEKERLLLAAFQRGDNDTGYKIINEIINGIQSGNPQNLEMRRIRAIDLVVLLSRANAAPAATLNDAFYKDNDKNLKRIRESKTNEELIEKLHLAVGQMASEIFSFRGMRHASALRRAQCFIWKNLARKVSLAEIAKAVGLSAPYFSTVFKEEMGENFSSYINRLRIEKATALLTETGIPIKTVATFCGFVDQSWFSKIFKHFTGITPGKYREAGNPAGDGYAS